MHLRLRDLREEPINFIRQQKLADLIGVHVSVYSKYENETNKEIIPIEHLNTICNHFNVSLDYIFCFTDTRNYNGSRKELDFELASKRLEKIRNDKKITQLQLANNLNFNQSTISKYEKNERKLSTQFVYYFCKEYKLSADYLLGKIDN